MWYYKTEDRIISVAEMRRITSPATLANPIKPENVSHLGICWCEEDPKPGITPLQKLSVGPVEQRGHFYYRTWIISDLSEQEQNNTLKKEQQAKSSEITEYKKTYIKEGKTYVFPDSLEGTVQLRNEGDEGVIRNLAIRALISIHKGTTETLKFRDEENVIHSLTPQETLTFTDTVLSWIEQVAEKSWEYKDNVKTITTPESIDEIINYDYTLDWPVKLQPQI